ncbi:ABC transporter permease [Sinorhizobium meliloti]|uniref:ABC transporter, permease n=1 Tax=Rhizobium meliloti (strain 1021) TaxID=266834 RepID=Q930E0_RHIME|nr:ABC transporter permease [Sinorhizobium meliloti]MDX0430672.1 ABC transporter permease subunit [Sinorhizobium medicae]TWA88557.1 amino acid ABC transporter membrane protein 2 (PAAT family) [Ensifer sp. SEMIA 134]TWB24056.1 amino acid ABC transporter membrane protein 2 (PAAT family) [Ensifer sp. SEMIA 135]AAK64916.1 ABC transporter, permease [Sinorhizobium meliloti 1021]AEG07568.1 polar amino acid ABC transporter, inner membrane subunit [Sinorhizobium meliloti BL225C]
MNIGIVFDAIPRMLGGIVMTFQLLLLSLAIGTMIAVLLLLMRISGRWWLSWPAQFYTYVFRGTPILVQIFIVYYGLPQFEWIRESIFWPILRDPFGCAILALSLNTGAYLSEIFRGGVLAVERGLLEAGAALGMSATHRFIYITTPLAIRIALPAYGNEVISLMKSTALASTITLVDMTGIGRTIVAETFAPYQVFLSLAIVYVAITWIIQRSVKRLEVYLGRSTAR